MRADPIPDKSFTMLFMRVNIDRQKNLQRLLMDYRDAVKMCTNNADLCGESPGFGRNFIYGLPRSNEVLLSDIGDESIGSGTRL